MKVPRRIGLCMGRMSEINDGLSEFKSQLGLELARSAERLKEEEGIEFTFRVKEKFHGFFGSHVRYLPIENHQRWWRDLTPSFDVWHTTDQLNPYLPPRHCKRMLLTVHDLNFAYAKKGLSLHRYMWQLNRRIRQYDEIITITNHVKADVERLLTFKGPIQTIHNGVRDLSQLQRDPVEGVKPPYLLHLSRMAPTKNVEAILGLAAIWPEQQFVLAGPQSPNFERIRQHIEASGLRNVLMRNDVTDAQKAWLYANCEGFIFPSFTEGFGLPPIEAMSFGKPVFLSRLTSLPEVGGDAAKYFADFSPAYMKSLIQSTLSAPPSASTIVARAHNFSWEACTERYIRHYVKSSQK